MTEIPREKILCAREAYRAGKPVDEICIEHGFTRGTLYYWLHGGPGEDNDKRLPPIPLRYVHRAARATPRKSRRKQIVDRVWRTAGKQLREIEQRMALAGRHPDARERDARLLAVVVKTLRELSAFDAAASAPRENANNVSDTDEPNFDNIDEFRLALARRLEGIIAERKDAGGDGGPAI